MSTVWFTSDTHFFHKRILEFTDRPCDSVEEMNEALVSNWNERVAKGDRVYHLGDFSFGTRSRTEEIIGRLRGQIHLIRGNHDDVLDRFAGRFASYQEYKELRIDGQKLVLFHFPIESWHGAHKGSWHLHGHCHGTLKTQNGPRLDVGVDPMMLCPVSFERVRSVLSAVEPWVPVDHHAERETPDDHRSTA